MVALFFMLTLAACAGGTDTGPSDPNPVNNTPSTTDPTTSTTPSTTAPSYTLEWVTQGPVTAEYGADSSLSVRLLKDNKPVANGKVLFSATGNVGQLSASEQFTDQNGVATVTLTAGQSEASGSVSVADSEKKAPAISLLFAVIPRSAAQLKVLLTYGGKRALPSIKVLLIENNAALLPDCDAVEPGNITAKDERAVSTVSQPALFNGLKNGNSYRVVSVVYNSKGYAVASACHDDVVTISNGKDQSITIDLFDLAPSYAGTYVAEYDLDLISGLPDDVESTVNTVINTIKNPGGQVLTWACAESTSSFCSGLLKDIIGSVITEVVKAAVKQNKTISSLYFGASEITDIMKTFKLNSLLTFDEEPDAQGVFSKETTREELVAISYRWTYGQNCDPADNACGVSKMSSADAGLDSSKVSFESKILDMESISIKGHTFAFSYGTLLSNLIEKVVLPRLAQNPKINSYDALLYEILGGEGCMNTGKAKCCGNFGTAAENWAYDNFGITLGAYAAGSLACELAIPYGANALRDQFKKLDPDGLDGLILGTPQKTNCPIEDSQEMMQIDRFSTIEAACTADARVKIGDSYHEILGSFTAMRQVK